MTDLNHTIKSEPRTGIALRRLVRCPECDGRGMIGYWGDGAPAIDGCPTCETSGQVPEDHETLTANSKAL